MTHGIEERLRQLELQPPEGLAARVLAQASAFVPPETTTARHAGWRLRLAIGAAFFIVANAIAILLAPGYGRLLAQTPGIQQLAIPALQRLGLSTPEVNPASVEATSAGHTLQLLGAYADNSRVVVVLRIDTQPSSSTADSSASLGIEKAVLVDERGNEYSRTPGGGIAAAVDAVSFGPLGGVRPGEKVHLKLVVTGLLDLKTSQSINGQWVMPFEATMTSAVGLPLPKPGEVGGDRFTFTSVTLSGRLVTLDWEVSGPTVDEIRDLAYPQTPPALSSQERLAELSRSLFLVLRSSFGQSRVLLVGSGGATPPQGPATGSVVAVVEKPGVYSLVVAGSGTVVATLTVP